jgi:hypothetical protein
MDCALTCILVLVEVCLQQAVVNLHRNINNLVTDFMNLPNRMFLFINCSLSHIQFVSQIFVGHQT